MIQKEIQNDTLRSKLQEQAKEADADIYAVHFALHNLLQANIEK